MSDDDDRRMILETVDRFCRERLPTSEVGRRDAGHVPPYDLIAPMAELGLIRAPFPEAVGGHGLGWSTLCRIYERLGASCGAVASILDRVISFGGMPILQVGDERQQREILQPLLDGRVLIALALSEPGAGSDVRSTTLRAVHDGETWRLTGRKTWISDAGHADYLLTLARTSEPGDRPSFTAFLTPRQADGLTMTQIPKVGNNCMPSFDIGFDEVTVPDSLRLGRVGKGLATMLGALTYSRAGLASMAVGCAQAVVDLALAHARERVQFGHPLSDFQVIRHRLVDMAIEVKKARLVVYELARQIDAGEPAEASASIAKVVATEALQRVSGDGMQILASAGYAAESAMQRYWRDARLYTFGEGSNEIQREVIAGHLGLGRWPA